MLTVDGSDFRIQEPRPFSPIWFSHKFNGPGLRYELGICISTGLIAWQNGPYPPGDLNDLEIYRLFLISHLNENECVEADEGYRGDDTTRVPSDFEGNEDWKRMKARAMARHETINAKFKEFNILRNVYRGDKNTHYRVFNAVAMVIQSEILCGRATWQVGYNIHRERTF